MFTPRKLKDGELCPFLKSECARHECALYIKVVGMNPQTGETIDRHGCTFAHLPLLMIEQANEVRKTAASVDKTATQVNKLRAMLMFAMPENTRNRLLAADPKLIPGAEDGDPRQS
jgi:hypothetical protein